LSRAPTKELTRLCFDSAEEAPPDNAA